MAGHITEGVSDPGASGAGFPVASCPTCGRVVLAHLWIAEDGAESHRCIHCDAVLTDGEVRWVDEDELGEIGYVEIADTPGCGRPDCGRGRCGR